MPRHLFAAAALAPLYLAASPALAAAITDTVTTPVATSTADGTAGDLTISGTVTSASTTPAVTLDSANTVTNSGTIQTNNVDGSTAVSILGGNAGAFTNSGSVYAIEDFEAADANENGVYEAPLAVGSGRFGVRLWGPGAFTGNLTNTGTIAVEGNRSVGVSIESPLNGAIGHTGSIAVTGADSFGLKTTAPIGGDINLAGSVAVSGQNSTAVSIGGDVGGRLLVYSSLSANGYGTSSRASTDALLQAVMDTPAERLQSSAALVIAADINQGVFIGAPPYGTTSQTTTDGDEDGIVDADEGSGSVVSFGSAPAVQVGAANRSVTLGPVGAGQNAYGFILRGAVSASGLYDAVSATGIQLGGLGGAVSISGGLRITGTLGALAYEADATALRVGAGAEVPVLQLENAISAAVADSSLTSADTAATATAVRIEAGGRLGQLINYGTLSAAVVGNTASAVTIADAGGGLTDITNLGAITADVSSPDEDGVASGQAIALDLRANASGVTLRQIANPNPIAIGATTETATNGTTSTVTVYTPASPSIVGDILLGSGPNRVDLLAGSITGALSLGTGAASLTIDGGATYTGALTYGGDALALTITNGVLNNLSAQPIQASSLSVGAAGTLRIGLDAAAGRAGAITVAGAATLADGAKVGVSLLSNLSQTPQTYTLIRATNLQVGALSSLSAEVPYLSLAQLRVSDTALLVDIRRRTAAEAGLNPGQSAAYEAVYSALGQDAEVQSAFTSAYDRDSFIGLYDQMLPQYSGGTFRLASMAARAVSAAAADASPVGGGWVQEIAFGARYDGDQANPYSGVGFGFSGGVERRSPLGVFGVSAAFMTGRIGAGEAPGDTRSDFAEIEAGLYWRAALGGLQFDARGGAGRVDYSLRRQLLILDADGEATLSRMAEAEVGGYALNGRLGVGYRLDLGRVYLRPQAHLDYVRLRQSAYTEEGGGDAFNLAVDASTAAETSATAALRLGVRIGQDFQWRPEVEVGYRSVLSGGAASLSARYVSTGDSFTLDPAALSGATTARLSLRAGNDAFDLNFSVGAEAASGYLEGDFKFRARLHF